jgi:integrase/recombinase XerD
VPLSAPLTSEVSMLVELYPRAHRRYSSLPILGGILEKYGDWLSRHGYPRHRIRMHFHTARRLVRELLHRGVRHRGDLTRDRLRSCAPADTQDDKELAALVSSLVRFFESDGLFGRPPSTRVERKAVAYGDFLRRVRGLAPSTTGHHVATAVQFLSFLGYEERPTCLRGLAIRELERFIRVTGERISRASLQLTVAHLRGFLRFLAASGEAAPELHTQLDRPRVYRDEKLPRALPWEIVQRFLRSIDRSTPIGVRDYAMFLLMVSYGLRASDVVTLKLDDVHWRGRRISVVQRKTGAPLALPLSDEVGAALFKYLRSSRRPLSSREVFLRVRAPAGALKPTAVGEAFQAWSRRSGLPIPFQGPHCLRHSLATHLLRQGVSLKTIGDVLGHVSSDSTTTYLRLAVEDLRGVALAIPSARMPTEVRQ